MADNNILKGMWCFNNNITYDASTDFDVNFICDVDGKKQFDRIQVNDAGSWLLYGLTDNVYLAYDGNNWGDENTKTIVITDETEQTEGFLTWLQANANKVNFSIDTENTSVNDYLYNISSLQTAMQELIIAEGGTVQYKSLEQYMNSLVILRKKFVEMLNNFGIEVDEGQKMSPEWAENFISVIKKIFEPTALSWDPVDFVDNYITVSRADIFGGVANYTKTITMNKLEYIYNSFAYGNNSLRSVNMPMLKEINNHTSGNLLANPGAFQQCLYLESVYMPLVEFIDYGSFANSFRNGETADLVFDSLTRIGRKISTNQTYYNIGAFSSTYKIRSFTAPNCTFIGYGTFQDSWSEFEEITFGEATIASRAFSNCQKLKTVNGIIRDMEYSLSTNTSTFNKHGYQFYGCTALTSIEVNGVISNYAFNGCTALTTVKGKPTMILYSAFNGCTALTEIDLSEVTQMVNPISTYGSYFQNTKIIDAYMPKLTKLQGSSAFQSTLITRFYAPLLETTSGVNWFYGCSDLKTANLGLINRIEQMTFYNCVELTDIYLGYDGLVVLNNTTAFGGAGTTQGYINVHVRSDYADSYATATNWSSLIAQGKIIIVGDYSD